ncbi:hypothetical protein [Streptomyces sp. NPDC054854]
MAAQAVSATWAAIVRRLVQFHCHCHCVHAWRARYHARPSRLGASS